jgi:hypothetical protein
MLFVIFCFIVGQYFFSSAYVAILFVKKFIFNCFLLEMLRVGLHDSWYVQNITSRKLDIF